MRVGRFGKREDRSPVSGTVVATNNQVEDDPSLINSDPYTNWIVKVEMSDVKELDSLLSAAAYENIL